MNTNEYNNPVEQSPAENTTIEKTTDAIAETTTPEDNRFIYCLEFIKAKYEGFPIKLKRTILVVLALIILIIGILIGCSISVSHEEHNSTLAQMQNVLDRLNETENQKAVLQAEFESYRAKMQPYEAQQQSDEAAAAQKAIEEKEAKKAAEEAAAKAKAEKEAAEKAKQEAEAKAGTLGISASDFYKKYNMNAVEYGADMANIPSDTSSSYVSAVVNNAITVDVSQTKSGYATMITVNYNNSGNDSEATQFALSFVSSARAIDNSIDYQTALNIANELMLQSAKKLGEDVTKTHNGVKYTFNSIMGSTIAAIRK